MAELAVIVPNVTFTLGEANSLYGGGAPGISNVFGAALWVLDFSLYCASQNVARVNFHQSEGAPYNAWNPRQNVHGPPATLPPFYGNAAVATFLGNQPDVQVVSFARPSSTEAIYAAYSGGSLTSMAIINMNIWNSTDSGDRSSTDYVLQLPNANGTALVSRLHAAGADVTTGVTLGGVSFDYNVGQGKPVNVSGQPPEIVSGSNGTFTINVPFSEAAILTF